MTTQMERRAADARRTAAEQAAERGGNDEAAFLRQRSKVAGVGQSRRVSNSHAQLRGAREVGGPSGKLCLHTTGYFTTYERGYQMWDDFGLYTEMTMRGSGRATLAAKPDVAFLLNHRGVTMARTTNGSLVLAEHAQGGFHEGWLNLARRDVADLAEAIDDEDVTEMSFAFMIPEGQGIWSDDFTTFQIRAYDLDRGDVSAVNYGANPYTDISGAQGEIMRSLDQLPQAARAEAAHRLGVEEIEQQIRGRERVKVGAARKVDRGASQHVRNLQWRVANTAHRYAELAAETGLSVSDLVNVRLPWFEVVDAIPFDPDSDGDDDAGLVGDTDGDATDVLIYDEIGGSFGTSADDFAAALAGIETPRINLRINSPGGSVVDAIAIASSIRHKRDTGTKVVSYVDGIAASAATFIAIAADEVVAMPGSEWMVHFASSTIDGNKVEAGKMQTFLDFQDRNIADMYALKSGTAPEWLVMMEQETWFTAEEAMNAGLVDRVWNSATKKRGERAATDPRMTRRWGDLPYRYNGRADAPVTQQRRCQPTSNVVALEESIAAAERGVSKLLPEGFTARFDRTPYRPETFRGNPAVDGDAFDGMVADYVQKVDQQVAGSGSTPSKTAGRSISRIEAEFAALGANLAE